jgi:transcriptional regulator with XRE-family HTH domain
MGRKDSSVGARLRKKVDELASLQGKTTRDVLAEAGVTQYVWDNGLASHRGPRIADLGAVANALTVQLYQLCHDKDGMILAPEDDLTFGDKVDGKLGNKGWGRNDLAVQLGLTPRRLEAILDAKNPGVKAVKRIAEALEVTVDELLT